MKNSPKNKKQCFLILGPQASGKTTFSNEMLKKNPFLNYVCSDLYWPTDEKGNRYWIDACGFRRCWYRDPIPSETKDKAYSWARRKALEYMQEQQDILFEATLVDQHTRKRFLQDCQTYNYQVEGLFLFPSLLVCAQRNATREHPVPDVVLARTYAKIEVPTKDEGFHKLEIIEIN